jgi:WD40 repeat protein
VATGKLVRTFESSPGALSRLAISPDGKLLAVATQEFPLLGDVTLWDVSTGKVRSTLRANGVDCLAFSPDGKTLAAGCIANYHDGKKETHHVRIWDVGTAKDLHYLRHEFRVLCVAVSADAKAVASGSECGELKLWQAATGKERVALPVQPSYVFSVAFSRDGKTLVSTTRDGLVKCWDALKLLDGPADK